MKLPRRALLGFQWGKDCEWWALVVGGHLKSDVLVSPSLITFPEAEETCLLQYGLIFLDSLGLSGPGREEKVWRGRSNLAFLKASLGSGLPPTPKLESRAQIDPASRRATLKSEAKGLPCEPCSPPSCHNLSVVRNPAHLRVCPPIGAHSDHRVSVVCLGPF